MIFAQRGNALRSLLGSFQRDATYAARIFARHRLAFATATVALAFALGLTASLFSLANAWLYPKVHIADPASVMWVTVAKTDDQGFWSGLTYRDFVALTTALPDTPLAAIIPSIADVRTSDGAVKAAVPVS